MDEFKKMQDLSKSKKKSKKVAMKISQARLSFTWKILLLYRNKTAMIENTRIKGL